MSFTGLLICSALVPMTMLGCGVWMLKRPPKEINGLVGYRTRRSRKNQQTWDFAQRMCGKVWTVGGAAILVLSLLPVVLLRDHPERSLSVLQVLMYVQIGMLLLSVVPVELALRRHFDDDGNPKN